MKNIDLSFFVGKNLNDLMKKGDQLFNDNLEGKIHAHKIYSELLEHVPNIYASTNEHAYRGMIRQKIWDCERSFFWNEKYKWYRSFFWFRAYLFSDGPVRPFPS